MPAQHRLMITLEENDLDFLSWFCEGFISNELLVRLSLATSANPSGTLKQARLSKEEILKLVNALKNKSEQVSPLDDEYAWALKLVEQLTSALKR